jgi:copper chaperone CopZ
MWADHHVVSVRELLGQDDGVTDVVASARDTTIRVTFDPARTSADQIAARLVEAGYPAGEQADEATPPTNKPAWATAGVRVTATDPVDLAMSGDHRKY